MDLSNPGFMDSRPRFDANENAPVDTQGRSQGARCREADQRTQSTGILQLRIMLVVALPMSR